MVLLSRFHQPPQPLGELRETIIGIAHKEVQVPSPRAAHCRAGGQDAAQVVPAGTPEPIDEPLVYQFIAEAIQLPGAAVHADQEAPLS